VQGFRTRDRLQRSSVQPPPGGGAPFPSLAHPFLSARAEDLGLSQSSLLQGYRQPIFVLLGWPNVKKMSPKPLGFQISPTLFNRLLLGFVLILLLALRLKVFLHANALMIDEANLAMNLAERNFEGLWRSLDYEQYAPPLFLSWAKASIALLGMNEYALRMPAMVSAILCMYLIVQLGRKAPLKLSPPYIALVLILFGSSHTILLQGDLIKQYTTDAMWSLLFVNLALKYSFRFILSPGGKLFWTLIGSLAIWCSMPAVFLLATIGVYYFYQASKEDKSILLLQHLLIPGFIWVAQFVIYFFTILKSDAESDYLQTYHQRYFFDYAF